MTAAEMDGDAASDQCGSACPQGRGSTDQEASVAEELDEQPDVTMANDAAPAEEAGSRAEADEEPALWVQCDHCEKWRRLPVGTSPPAEELPWDCSMNPDVTKNTVGPRADRTRAQQAPTASRVRPSRQSMLTASRLLL